MYGFTQTTVHPLSVDDAYWAIIPIELLREATESVHDVPGVDSQNSFDLYRFIELQ